MNNLNIVHEITFRKGKNVLHVTKFEDNKHEIVLTKSSISKTRMFNDFESARKFAVKRLNGW